MHYRDFVGTGKKLIVYHHWALSVQSPDILQGRLKHRPQLQSAFCGMPGPDPVGRIRSSGTCLTPASD